MRPTKHARAARHPTTPQGTTHFQFLFHQVRGIGGGITCVFTGFFPYESVCLTPALTCGGGRRECGGPARRLLSAPTTRFKRQPSKRRDGSDRQVERVVSRQQKPTCPPDPHRRRHLRECGLLTANRVRHYYFPHRVTTAPDEKGARSCVGRGGTGPNLILTDRETEELGAWAHAQPAPADPGSRRLLPSRDEHPDPGVRDENNHWEIT